MNISSIIHCVNLFVNFFSSSDNLSVGVFSGENGFNFSHIRLNYNVKIEEGITLWPLNFYVIDRLSNGEIQWFAYIHRHIGWFRPRATKFLFIGTHFSNETLRSLASYHLLDTMFLNTDSGCLYTTYPYRKGFRLDVDTEMSKIGFYDGDKIIMNEINLFQTKIPTNWNNTKFHVIYQRNPVFSNCFKCSSKNMGIESEIISTILKYLGISVSVKKFTDLEKFIRENPKYRKDLIFGVQYAEFWLSPFDTTAPYLEEDVAFFVASPQLLPRWKFIFTIFNMDLWIAWMISVLLISVTWSLKYYIFSKKIVSEYCFDIWIAAYKLFLGQSFSFHGQDIFHGILVVCIVFLSTMMYFFFGTRLTYLLNGVNYETGIESIKDIRDNQLYIASTGYLIQGLMRSESKLKGYPEQMYLNCFLDDMIYCMNRSIYKRDTVLLFSVRQVQHAKIIKIKMKNSILKQLPPILFSAKIIALFEKGHPAFPLINRMLQYLVESGIVNKIIEKYDKMMNVEESSLGTPEKLRLEHICAPSFVLFIGFICGSMIFIWEYKYYGTDA